jgi:hypothetical protein
MNKSIFFVASCLACIALHASDELTIAASRKPTQPAPKASEEITIGQTTARQKRDEEWSALAAADAFRLSQAGDHAAKTKWSERKLAGLARVLVSGRKELRHEAIKALAGMSEGSLEADARLTLSRALGYAAVKEDDKAMRGAARASWASLACENDTVVNEMLPALDFKNVMEAGRAFEALKDAGGLGVAEALITKITERWGKFARGHILIGTQRSYIADYDVSGAVYDPVIKSYLTGVVLDTQILEVIIETYIVEQLRALGADPDVIKAPKLWTEFIKKKRNK